MRNIILNKYWKEFQHEMPEYKKLEIPQSYYFCDNAKDAHECAELVRKGIKRATTHSVSGLEINKEETTCYRRPVYRHRLAWNAQSNHQNR